MPLSTNPEFTGQGGGIWKLTSDQWFVVTKVVMREMIRAGGPQDPETPNTVGDYAAALVAAFIKDPCGGLNAVRAGERINWRLFACIAAWFHGLPEKGRSFFWMDVFQGDCAIWQPVLQLQILPFCPGVLIQDPALENAEAILAAPIDVWHPQRGNGEGDVWSYHRRALDRAHWDWEQPASYEQERHLYGAEANYGAARLEPISSGKSNASVLIVLGLAVAAGAVAWKVSQ